MKRSIALCAMVIAVAVAAFTFVGCAGSENESAVTESESSASEASSPVDAQASDADDIATPSTAGALHVEGTQLTGEQGEAVQLRGVSTHGLAWFPQYVNQTFFNELRQDWGANVVRLAMYTAESGGYCTDGDQAALEQLVTDGVGYATEADLYVVVDWHILSDANPLQHQDAAKAFFAKMSAAFAENNNVIYEICNEPNGATTWADITAYANEIIPVIRANNPNAVVVVGTPTWSQRVDEAAADPLAFDNVMYALHFYAATHQQDLRDKLETAVGDGLPVFVSEFGICDASGNGRIDYASADAWVRLMDDLQVSYLCWNLSNKNEASALFKPDCTKTSGFTEDDLSAEGQWLQKVLHGEVPADDSAASYAEGGAGAGGAGGAGGDGAAGGAGAAGSSTYAGTAGNLAFEANLVNSWEAEGKTYEQYGVTLTNNGSAVSGWEITIPMGHPFTLSDSWNGVFSTQGSDVHIANVDYNGALAANTAISDIGFIIYYLS